MDAVTARKPKVAAHAGDGPDFLCVGAQKGGTRWLYDQVQLHPDFWMPPIKELHYFDRKKPSKRAQRVLDRAEADLDHLNTRRRKKKLRPLEDRDFRFLRTYLDLPWSKLDLDAYVGLFCEKGSFLTGDITPDYCVLRPEKIARIVGRFPDIKVLFIARDPVARLWSHINMHIRKGDLDPDLSDRQVLELAGKRFIARRTYQTDIVARWRRYVAPDRFRLFLFDDLIAEPKTFRADVFTFLGADAARANARLKASFNRKKAGAKTGLSDGLKAKLAQYLAVELQASAREFGGAAEAWPAKYGL